MRRSRSTRPPGVHCQKKIAQAIRGAGRHHVMQVKANLKALHEQVRLLFDEAIVHGWPPEAYWPYPVSPKNSCGDGRI